jgi:hypothetical protein
MSTEKKEFSPEVKEFEQKFPEMAAEFKKIMYEEYEMFCKKQLNYGKGNIMLGGDVNDPEDRKLAMSGIVIRMNDKVNRLITLMLKGNKDYVNESILDTFQDLCNYSIIAQMVSREKWK